ncbi:MAG: nitroreductase family protein [Planctomycetales bacterium]|nr:nitroreductase family protein [Planctomycetales bacterium]MCA9222837.1 nitroreductase family protein [Planctomycetales bacterium]
MGQLPDPLEHRTADYPIELLFLKRWSPRAMSGESLTHDELMTLFEAARWAPSTYNEQEWRYLYATRDSQYWADFLGLLVEANQAWCQHAAALVVVASHRVMTRNGSPNPVHSFDAGASFQNLSLQGAAMGLVVHGMAGFDREQARKVLSIPDDYQVEAMIALGRPGDPDLLPDLLRQRELPSGRKPMAAIVCEGQFSFD